MEWSERWSTPLGTMDANAPVADGVLVDLSIWATVRLDNDANAN